MGKAVLNLLRFTLLQRSARQGCPRLLSSPSPFGRQKQSCILPCPQGAAPLSPTSNPARMRRAQHLHHSSPGMLMQAGGSLPPLLRHSLLCPQCSQPQTRHCSPGGLTCLTVPASGGSLGCAELLTDTPAQGCTYRPAPTGRGEL